MAQTTKKAEESPGYSDVSGESCIGDLFTFLGAEKAEQVEEAYATKVEALKMEAKGGDEQSAILLQQLNAEYNRHNQVAIFNHVYRESMRWVNHYFTERSKLNRAGKKQKELSGRV